MNPPTTRPLSTSRLDLTPLSEDDAREMVDVLGSASLYEFTGGEPPTLSQLEHRYRAQVLGAGHDGEVWHNWIIRSRDTQTAIGFVQATVTGDIAEIAWVVGTDFQRQGVGGEAALAMCNWLTTSGVRRIEAHIHPEHIASMRVAAHVGLASTGELDDEGEVIWVSPAKTAE